MSAATCRSPKSTTTRSRARARARGPTTEPQREVWLADKLGRDASLAFNESISLQFAASSTSGALRTRCARYRRGTKRCAPRSAPTAWHADRCRAAAAGSTSTVPLREAGELDCERRASRRRAVRSRARAAGPRRAGQARPRSPRAGASPVTTSSSTVGRTRRDRERPRRAVRGDRDRCTHDAAPPAPSYVDYAMDIARAPICARSDANEAWWIGGVPGWRARARPTDRSRASPRCAATSSGREDHAAEPS